MPVKALRVWPRDRRLLYELGVRWVEMFCKANDDLLPPVKIDVVPRHKWIVGACAYYRSSGIKICLEECGTPASEGMSRNWTWPGSTVDREPFGVLCHELGHHADYHTSNKGARAAYYGNFSTKVKKECKESPISGYHDGDEEWFAEMFRLFVTNHELLRQLRPKTWEFLNDYFTPVSPNGDWRTALGANVPARVVRSLVNKGAR